MKAVTSGTSAVSGMTVSAMWSTEVVEIGITLCVGDCLLPVWGCWRSTGSCPIGHVSHRLRHTGCVSATRPKPRVVVIVVFDGVKLLDAAGPAEVFAEANRFGAEYQLKIASVDGRDVMTSIGTGFAVTDRIAAIESADTVLVAGGDGLVGRPIDMGLVVAVEGG